MISKLWQQTLIPPGNEDQLWELFHENSKVGRHTNNPTDDEVRCRMEEMDESLTFEGYPVVDLPTDYRALSTPIGQVLSSRISNREFIAGPIPLEFLANLLHHSYGVTRENADNGFPRPFRIVPSAGALYPLEIFFHSSKVQGLQDGIYHYHPARNCLRQLSPRNESKNIAERLIQPEIALEASVIIFITAIFERSVFKYGDRGYRFVLLEAGHVAQNMNLVGNALGLGCVNLGGFFDREIDDFLGLDGVTHSTLYLIAIGKRR